MYYRKCIRDMGITYLSNKTSHMTLKSNDIAFTGLDLKLSYFRKLRKVKMEEDYLKSILPKPSEESFNILLAHSPSFFANYASWGADLVLSGHTHGGLVRIPGVGAVISPELLPFPKYDAGRFEREGSVMLISKGLGTHTYPVRIFDRAELLDVCIRNG